MKIFMIFTALLMFSLSAEKLDKPNIIWMVSEDNGARWLGCYGNPEVKTPNMDKIAQRSMMFMNHYNTTSICMASRAKPAMAHTGQ